MADGKWALCILLIAVYVHILLIVTAKMNERYDTDCSPDILDQSSLRQQEILLHLLISKEVTFHILYVH